jgi:hypothetical protein
MMPFDGEEHPDSQNENLQRKENERKPVYRIQSATPGKRRKTMIVVFRLARSSIKFIRAGVLDKVSKRDIQREAAPLYRQA